jgi:hypothetical protein
MNKSKKSIGEQALEIMLRREWSSQKCSGDEWVVVDCQTDNELWTVIVRKDMSLDRAAGAIEATYHNNPFIALINADKYYCENID